MSKALKIGIGECSCCFVLALPWLLNAYVLQILILTITYSMLGLAFAFTLRVGLPRFDIAAWWAIGAYTTAMLMRKADMSFWLTLPIGGLHRHVCSVMVVFVMHSPRNDGLSSLRHGADDGDPAALRIRCSFSAAGEARGRYPDQRSAPFSLCNKPELYYMGLVFLAVNLLVY